MKLLIAFAVLCCAFVSASPQDKGIVQQVECWICHSLGPHLEAFADDEAEVTEEFLLKECHLLGSVIERYCDDWLHKYLDPLIELLRADECMSSCIACDLIIKCGSGDCQQSNCNRPNCHCKA